jgi:hypothetical protein
MVTGNRAQETAAEQAILEYDREGNPLNAESIVAKIEELVSECQMQRVPFELQWRLNGDFLVGNQNRVLNSYAGCIMDARTPPFLGNEVYNRISSLMDTRFANLKLVDFAMLVNPATDEISDKQKAKVSTALLRYAQKAYGFDDVKDNMIQWAELTGTCFLLSWYDNEKGEKLGEIEEQSTEEDENGNIVQLPPVKRAVHTGDIQYGLLSPYQVYPESLYKQEISDQRYIIIEQVMSAEDIYDLYGAEVKGEDISTYSLTPIFVSQSETNKYAAYTYKSKKCPDSLKVRTYYERRSRRYPDGRMIIVVGDKLIYYGIMPYKEIPLVSVKSKVTPDQFYGKSLIEDAIPLQRKYNELMNLLMKYIRTTAVNARYVEEGSIDFDDMEEMAEKPGFFVPYKRGFQPPIGIQYVPLDAKIYEQLANTERSMEYIFGVSQLMMFGQAPSGVTSGKAIGNLKDIDSTRMSLVADNIRDSILHLAKIWLNIYKQYGTGYRAVQAIGQNNMGAALVWCSDDINSYDITFEVENELAYSKEQQREDALLAFQMGLFADEKGMISDEAKQKLINMLKAGSVSFSPGEDDLQKSMAEKENAFVYGGVIPQISRMDNHRIHIDKHRAEILQGKFDIFKQQFPQIAAAFEAHEEAHEQKLAEKARNEQRQAMQMAQMGRM